MKNIFNSLIAIVFFGFFNTSCKKCITCTFQISCVDCIFTPNDTSIPIDTVAAFCESNEVYIDEQIQSLKQVYNNGIGTLQCVKYKSSDKLEEKECGMNAEETSSFLLARELLGYTCVQDK